MLQLRISSGKVGSLSFPPPSILEIISGLQYTCSNQVLQHTCSNQVLQHTYSNQACNYICSNQALQLYIFKSSFTTLQDGIQMKD